MSGRGEINNEIVIVEDIVFVIGWERERVRDPCAGSRFKVSKQETFPDVQNVQIIPIVPEIITAENVFKTLKSFNRPVESPAIFHRATFSMGIDPFQ